MKQERWLDQVGLRLSRQALRVLKERGIFVQAAVSVEHQHLAKRYVVRGLESGGAVGELRRYVTFTQEDGQPIEWLHPVEAIGVNGLHAVVVAPVLVRVEMLRKGRTSCVNATRSFAASSKALRIVRERLGYKASTGRESGHGTPRRAPRCLGAYVEIQVRQQAHVQST